MNQTPRYGEIGVYGNTASQQDRGMVGTAMRQVGETAGNVAHTLQRTAGNVAHQASELAHQAQSTAMAATQTAGEKIGQIAHTTQDAAMSFAHGTQDLAVNFAHGAQEQAVRLEKRVETTYRENPLAVGAAVLALGTAFGLAIPITRREEQLMGEARDQMFGKAQGLAHDALDKVQDVAKHVAQDATQALKEGATTQKMHSAPSPR